MASLFLCVKFCSAGLEILEEIPEPDVVIVCCGGGGLLSGVAAAIKLLGEKTTRIFGVEPEGGRYLILIFFYSQITIVNFSISIIIIINGMWWPCG